MIKTSTKRPLPKPRNSYPFGRLKIGESFDVPLTERHRARSAASQHERRVGGGVKFIGRTVSGKFRIWRSE